MMCRRSAAWSIVMLLAVCATSSACSSKKPGARRTAASADAGGKTTHPARSDGGRDAALGGGSGHDDSDAGSSSDAADGGSTSDAGATSILPASCRDGFKNGKETDIDCGGALCGTCLSGRACQHGSDCASGSCNASKCTCLPLKACPAGACGTVHDCGGDLECGSCKSGVCYENLCCAPKVCKKNECGVFSDGCGGTIRCGDQSCCTPRTCAHPSLQDRCGDFDDRCGGSVSCACGDQSAVCYLAQCCQPASCTASSQCGVPESDGCGGTLDCKCSVGKTCYQKQCCTLNDCSSWTGPGCGVIDDGCGGQKTCGCTGGQMCKNAACCTQVGCPAGNPGDTCGASVSDSCGGTLDCGCSGSQSCYQNACCQGKSCSDAALHLRCGPNSDGCGTSLWCGCAQTNGMHVTLRGACGSACADTITKLQACMAAVASEVLDQTAGWDFAQVLSTSPCNAGYGFSPNWSQCPNGFSLDAQGYIQLDVGTHCFSVTGTKSKSCGALYFVSDPASFTGWDTLAGSVSATVVSGATPVCFNITTADYYPIRWFYTQSAWFEAFHVNHCAGGPTGCTAIPSSLLYPALP